MAIVQGNRLIYDEIRRLPTMFRFKDLHIASRLLPGKVGVEFLNTHRDINERGHCISSICNWSDLN